MSYFGAQSPELLSFTHVLFFLGQPVGKHFCQNNYLPFMLNLKKSLSYVLKAGKFELNWLKNKKVTKNLLFDGTSGKIREPKLEMTS